MSVRALRRGTMAGRGAAGTPTTYTLFGATGDGYIEGTGTPTPQPGDIFVGQQVGGRYEGFIAFDTSAVLGTITAVTLSLYGFNNSSTTDFIVEARIHDWGGTLESGDWVAAASLGAKTLVATFNTTGMNAAGYNVLTSDAAFVSNINQSGSTRLLLNSDRYRTGVSPSGAEFVGFRGAATSGTAQDPKLVIDALV